MYCQPCFRDLVNRDACYSTQPFYGRSGILSMLPSHKGPRDPSTHSSHSQPGIPSAQPSHRGPGITFLQPSHGGPRISSRHSSHRGPGIPSTQTSHGGPGITTLVCQAQIRHTAKVMVSAIFFQSLQYESSSKVSTSLGKCTFTRISICSRLNLSSAYKELRYFKKWTQASLCFLPRTILAANHLIINSENVGGRK